MKHVMKRFLSIALVCVMLFGMLPVSVFAEGTESEETNIVLTEPQEVVAEETTAPDTTVPETTVPAETVSETTVPETTVPEETVPETAVPEETVPETTVPDETVPEETVVENPVQDLYDTLMAFETYEALGDYMDNMTEEQYALLAQFSDDQNAALSAKIAELQDAEAETLAGGGGQGGGGQQSWINHIDVRVAGTLTITTRVNGVVVDEETVSVDVSNVSARLNGTAVSGFYEKEGSGDEHEWRCDDLSLTPASDTVEVTFTISGTREDGTPVNLELTKTYTGEAVLNALVAECPANNGYDIDILAVDLTESFTVDKTVTKDWDDNNNAKNARPSSVQVQLYRDGIAYGDPVTLNAANSWSATYENLPKYSSGTNEYVYTVDEVSVPAGYKKTVNGMTITNTYVLIDIPVEKVWSDANNQDGIRPASVTVNLLADDEFAGSATLSADNDWKYTFAGLNPDKTYTVTENEVNGYTAVVSGDKTNGFVVTNTHTPETTSVSGSKTWNDKDNQDGIRPTSITVNLLANGEKVESKTVTAEDDWKYTFTDLPKYKAGVEIVYTVEEVAVEGYDTTVDGYNITNAHTPETIDLTVEKKWDDADNQDGKRPTSITVNLLANGTQVASAQITPDADGKWTHTFTGFAKYEDGKEITYTVTEDKVDDYTTTYDGYIITNTHTPEKITISGEKTWVDNDDQDGIRPESITIHLFANGTEVASKSVTPDTDGNWAWSFTDLDKYANGAEIVYTVAEAEVAGYTAEVDGFDITNTHEIATTSVSGAKTWNDDNDRDGLRPESITINLLADGEIIDTVEVTEADGWAWSFTELPKYRDQGTEIVYTVTEAEVAGYTAEVDGFNITNTHEIATTSVSGAKTWKDDSDRDGLRPESITINLLADGKVIDTATVTSEDWSWSFTDLPKYRDQGTEIVYTITEDAVEGYEAEIDGFNVTNTHEIIKTSVEGKKTWDDNNDQDGVRPDSITINLLANGEEVASKTVTEADGWAWSFTDLPKYAAGEEITYTITEDAVEGYEAEIDGFNVTNTHEIIKTSVSVTKTWVDNDDQDGIRPEAITIRLQANGEVIRVASVVAEENGAWAYTFEGLDMYADGEEVVYTIIEDAVAEYTTEIDGFNVTNTHAPETVEVKGEKTWNDDDDRDGLRPESITINLVADGEIIETVEVTEADGWAWSFTELPKYRDHGTEIVYEITEEAVEGYESVIEDFNAVNTHEIAMVSVEGAKTWNDDNDRDGIRPESITINLLADGEIIDTVEVTEADGWAWSFTELPKYRDQGVEIVYGVAEETVEGYETAIEGFNVTNTHEIETVSVEGAKTWNDANNQDGKRPESITINLVADGEIIETIEVTEAEEWAWSFTDLPKYKDQGVEIVYAITENAVEGYSTTYDGYNVINSYTPEEISITVTKAWADSNNAEGIRPGSVTIRLLANGVFTGLTLDLDAQGKWVGSFTGLPKYFEGVQVEYTVDEVKVKGYTTVIKGSMEEGYTVTNTHVYIPQTGDDRTPIMWMSVMAVSCLMIALVTIDTKRRRAAK